MSTTLGSSNRIEGVFLSLLADDATLQLRTEVPLPHCCYVIAANPRLFTGGTLRRQGGQVDIRLCALFLESSDRRPAFSVARYHSFPLAPRELPNDGSSLPTNDSSRAAKCSPLDYTIRSVELQAVSSTAALNAESLQLSVDATARNSTEAELRAVWTPMSVGEPPLALRSVKVAKTSARDSCQSQWPNKIKVRRYFSRHFPSGTAKS